MDQDPESSAPQANAEVLTGLLEDFLCRRDEGFEVGLEEFLEKHPELAGDEREEFRRRLQALGMLEEALEEIQAAPPLMVGDGLGRFEILGIAGRGGMGEVYKARDSVLDRVVALKVLPQAFHTDPGRLRRFRREAATAARLSHPDLVTVFDLEEADGRIFLTMEFVEGVTVRQLIGKDEPPPESRIKTIATVSRGIAAAHADGIIHRDLKPENIMIRLDGAPKVLDFGLAKRFEEEGSKATMTGQVMGTANYMSPEQIAGKSVGPATDQFSLAVVLFEWLTGTVPFGSIGSLHAVEAILARHPRRLNLEAPWSRAVERVLLRALEKSPEDRYPSVGEFANNLERALKGDRVVGGRAPASVRHRRFFALWVALLLVTALFAFKTIMDSLRSEPSQQPGKAPLAVAQIPFVASEGSVTDTRVALTLNYYLASLLKRSFGGRLRLIPTTQFRGLSSRGDHLLRSHGLNANLTVFPTYHMKEGVIRVDIEVFNVDLSRLQYRGSSPELPLGPARDRSAVYAKAVRFALNAALKDALGPVSIDR